MSSEWKDEQHVREYLARAGGLPHRAEGELALLDEMPRGTRRILDLGTGDGRLLAMVLGARPGASGVALDFSPAFLEMARGRFSGDPRVRVVEHDLSRPLPEIGSFDVVVSSFAIHHLHHERKRELYGEILRLLEPGGVFCNLEHVESATPWLHQRYLEALGLRPDQEDPSNRLLDVETQLRWMRELGYRDVDCLWKWREFALLHARKET